MRAEFDPSDDTPEKTIQGMSSGSHDCQLRNPLSKKVDLGEGINFEEKLIVKTLEKISRFQEVGAMGDAVLILSETDNLQKSRFGPPINFAQTTESTRVNIILILELSFKYFLVYFICVIDYSVIHTNVLSGIH